MAAGDSEVTALHHAFSTLHENLQLAVDQLGAVQSKRSFSDDFSLGDFWYKIELIVKLVSQEATKLSLAFSHPPVPSAQDCKPLIEKMEQVTLALVSNYYSFPPAHGETLQTMLRKSIIDIITGTQQFISTMKDCSFQGSPEQLQSTGNVWQCCDSFPHLPKDNKLAAAKVASEAETLVKDALQELEEERQGYQEEEEEEEEQWTAAEAKTVDSCLGILRTAKAVSKKVHAAIQKQGSCQTEAENRELDSLAQCLHSLSPCVDEFVLTLYPPLNRDNILTQATQLTTLMSQLLSMARSSHITTEEDQSWVEFLEKAIDHNKSKLPV